MKLKLFYLLLLAAFCTVQANAVCPKLEKSDAPPAPTTKITNQDQPRFALLVGVTKYKNPEIPALRGSDNDVALMREVLVNNFGFADDAEHLKTLCTAEATRDAIITAFRQTLIENAKRSREAGREAIVVFHFSGHGSQYPDQDGDEAGDGADETILPFDTRTGGVFDILDDELDDLFAELAQYTSNITFILDNCHSGTGTRGEFVAREAAEDKKERIPYKRKFPATVAEIEARAEKYVTISAAMPNQKAYERPAEFAAAPNGELTFQLAAALRRATATTIWRDVIREVSAAIKNEMPYQDASVEGRTDAVVFSGASLKKDSSIAIASVKNDTLIFNAGRMSGINAGAQVAIYEETVTRFVGADGWLANAIVTEVRDYQSVAKLSLANSKVTAKSHLVLTARTFGGTPVSLVFDDVSLKTPAAAEVKTAILAKLKNNPVIANQLLEVIEPGATATKTADRASPILRLKRGFFKEAFPNRRQAVLPNVCMSDNDLLPPDETEIYYLDDGSGFPLMGQFFTAANPATPDNINKFLSNFAQFRNVQNIENTNSGLSYAVEASIEVQPQIVSYNCQKKDAPRRDARIKTVCGGESAQILTDGKMPQGAVYRVKIKNTSRFPLYLNILHLSNDGVISKLYPDPKLNGTEALQPGHEAFSVMWVTTQPAGKETIKILAVRKAENANFDYLLSPELPRRGDNSLLGKLLSQSGKKTRDEGLPPDEPDSWGVVTIDYQVTDKIAACLK